MNNKGCDGKQFFILSHFAEILLLSVIFFILHITKHCFVYQSQTEFPLTENHLKDDF